MNINSWLIDNLSFVTLSGSQAYEMATSTSDVDIKGVVLPPKEVREHLFEKFSQTINNPLIEERFSHLRNPLNPKLESTIYSLDKFFQLAAAVNPNIVELLWVAPEHILVKNRVGEEIYNNRHLFLSSVAKFRFSGYAYAQFAKIERHRKWLVKGNIQKPERKDFGLPEEKTKSFGEVERSIKKQIEEWNLSHLPLEDLERSQLKDIIWDLLYFNTQKTINWDNWPQQYERAALEKLSLELNLSSEINDLLVREVQYKNALNEYNNWLRWKNDRNLDRKKLEEKYLYDTKHGAHLMRLMRMGIEILEGKGVLTKRPDAQELLEIRNGKWTYDELVEQFRKLETQLDIAYKASKLPRSVNYTEINNLYQRILSL